MSDIVQIGYQKQNFNYMYRILTYYLENSDDDSVKENVRNLKDKIDSVHNFYFCDGEERIGIYFNLSDMNTLNVVYESLLFMTVEAREIHILRRKNKGNGR